MCKENGDSTFYAKKSTPFQNRANHKRSNLGVQNILGNFNFIMHKQNLNNLVNGNTDDTVPEVVNRFSAVLSVACTPVLHPPVPGPFRWASLEETSNGPNLVLKAD